MKKSSLVFGIVEAALFIILGIFILICPTTAMNIIIYLAGGILLISGIVALIRYGLTPEGKTKVLLIPQGLLGIIFGLILILGNSLVIALLLTYFLIFWFIVSGITYLSAATCFKGPLCIIAVLLNIFIIAISIWALFSAWFAFSTFIWTLAIIFIVVGLEKVIFLLGEKKTCKGEEQ